MPKYIARPVTVEAKRIIRVLSTVDEGDGSIVVEMEDGSGFEPSLEMLARMTPEVGDYVVEQEDGYVYINPADVFERKYRPAEDGE